jgi:hypothetical protein
MHNGKDLIDQAEECFRQADHQENHAAGEALRRKGLRHLEEAYVVWRKPAECVLKSNAGRTIEERSHGNTGA